MNHKDYLTVIEQSKRGTVINAIQKSLINRILYVSKDKKVYIYYVSGTGGYICIDYENFNKFWEDYDKGEITIQCE